MREWIPTAGVKAGDKIVCLLSDASAELPVTGWEDRTYDLTPYGLGTVVHRTFSVTGAPWWADDEMCTRSLDGTTLVATVICGNCGTSKRLHARPQDWYTVIDWRTEQLCPACVARYPNWSDWSFDASTRTYRHK